MKARTKIQDESGGSMAADAARIRELVAKVIWMAVEDKPQADIEAELGRFAAAVERGAIERCAKLAEDVYGDVVRCYGSDEPRAVGTKIASAIRLSEAVAVEGERK